MDGTRWAIAVVGTLLASMLASIGQAAAQSAPQEPTMQQLQQEIQQQQQQLRVLQQQLQSLQSAASAPAAASSQSAPASSASVSPPGSNPNALSGSFGPEGFTLQTADGANVIHFRGNISVDGRFFTDGTTPVTADTWLLRKLRPILEGTLDRHYDFRIMPDFGEGKTILQDGWVNAHVFPWLAFQFGKFKAPVGLERLQLEQYARFIEASLPSDLLPYRDLGAQVGGTLGDGVLTYDAGNFDGAVDGGSTDGNTTPDFNSTGDFTWMARLFAKPFLHTSLRGLQQVGVGMAGTYVGDRGVATTTTTTSLLAGYKTPGQQPMFSYRSNTASGYNNATIANGIERRLVPQAYYYYGPVGLMGEYVREDQQVQRELTASSVRRATLQNSAWQLQGYWFITGEAEGYDTAGPPKRPFGEGGPGAWELIARYHEIRFDPTAFTDGANSFANPATAPQSAHGVGVGVNWYLTQNFKVQLNYEVTRFEGGAITGNRPDERLLDSQFMLVF